MFVKCSIRSTILIISILFSSCSLFSSKRCKDINWYKMGYEDGIKGRIGTERQINDFRKTCDEATFILSEDKYNEGFEKGLNYLCTPAGALKAGRNGAGYTRVCDPLFQDTFDDNYYRGRKEYLKKQIEKKREQVAEVEKSLGQSFDSIKRQEIEENAFQLQTEIKTMENELQNLPGN